MAMAFSHVETVIVARFEGVDFPLRSRFNTVNSRIYNVYDLREEIIGTRPKPCRYAYHFKEISCNAIKTLRASSERTGAIEFIMFYIAI